MLFRSSWQREFQNALEAAGFEVRCQIIWAKNTFAWGFGRYKFQHEPIFYAHVADQKDCWYGDKTQSTLWQEKKPAANRIHPTAKPVELVERVVAVSDRGHLVFDLGDGQAGVCHHLSLARPGRPSVQKNGWGSTGQPVEPPRPYWVPCVWVVGSADLVLICANASGAMTIIGRIGGPWVSQTLPGP